MASTALFTGPEVSISNLAALPTWMGLRTVQRVQKTVKRTAARFEPRCVTRAVSKSQAGYQNVSLVEGVLAFSHAAISTVNSFSETFLQYSQDRCTPALVVSAVQQDNQITALEKEIVTGRTQAILAVAVLHEQLQHQTSVVQRLQENRITALEVEVVTGRTQAILAVAVLHEQLQHQTSVVQRLQDNRITALEDEIVTGRTQAMLSVAVLHKQLHQTTYGRHRHGAAMHTQSPSLVVGAANPLYTDAASLASVSSSSAQTQSLPDEASQSPDQSPHPMQAMFIDNDLYDLIPPVSAEAPEESASTGSVTPTRSFCLPAVIPSSPMECTSTDAQMESSAQTIQDDSYQNDTQAPAFVDTTGSFDGFRPHASVPDLQSCSDMSDAEESSSTKSSSVPDLQSSSDRSDAQESSSTKSSSVPNFQSSSDRSDAHESSSTTSSASPRSILPALHCPVPKLPLLCITTSASPNPAADPPVPDISSPALPNSSPSISALSSLTTYTPAAHKRPSSNLGKLPQTQQKRASRVAPRVAPVQKMSSASSVTSASISPAPQLDRRLQKSAPSPKTKLPAWK